MNGSVSSWNVKYINLKSKRVGYPSTERSINIAIYPSVSGCETVGSQSLCSVLPMCSYCFTTDSYRILLQDDTNTTTLRRLFNKILPTTSNPSNHKLFGYCIGADNSNACDKYPSLVSSDDSKYFWWVIAFCIPMAVVSVVLVLAIINKV